MAVRDSHRDWGASLLRMERRRIVNTVHTTTFIHDWIRHLNEGIIFNPSWVSLIHRAFAGSSRVRDLFPAIKMRLITSKTIYSTLFVLL